MLAILNALEDAILQLEKTLEDERRVSATLYCKRDDTLSSARIWERDLDVIRADLYKQHEKYKRLIDRWADLSFRIQEAHPDFNIWSRQHPKPPDN